MNVEEFIDGLSTEATVAVRGFLQQAYDRGFREALASAGQPVASVPVPIEQPSPASTPATPVPVEWVKDSERDADDASAVESDADEDDTSAGEVTAPRPILASATVGTLRRRIVRTFDLERFDIDVLICRSGDPDRRQLKSSVRLGSYRREEG